MLKDKIKQIRSSIVAIGFNPDPQRVTIIGSGFCVSNDGKILTAAHLYNNLKEDQIKNLKANVMVEQGDKDLERYGWQPISLVNKNDVDDWAIFQVDGYKETLLNKLTMANSDDVEVGQDVYFIGFPYAAQLINEGFGLTLVVNKGVVSNIKRDGR
ncbi:MAG: serine protease, partial [bacterium]